MGTTWGPAGGRPCCHARKSSRLGLLNSRSRARLLPRFSRRRQLCKHEASFLGPAAAYLSTDPGHLITFLVFLGTTQHYGVEYTCTVQYEWIRAKCDG